MRTRVLISNDKYPTKYDKYSILKNKRIFKCMNYFKLTQQLAISGIKILPFFFLRMLKTHFLLN